MLQEGFQAEVAYVGLGRESNLAKQKPGRRESNRQERGGLVENMLGDTKDRASRGAAALG